MTARCTGLLLVVLLMLVLVGAAANREFFVFEPDRVTVPENLTESEATKSLMAAFVMRGWRMTEVSRDQRYIDDGVVLFHDCEGENLPEKWLTERGGTGKRLFYKKERRVGCNGSPSELS